MTRRRPQGNLSPKFTIPKSPPSRSLDAHTRAPARDTEQACSFAHTEDPTPPPSTTGSLVKERGAGSRPARASREIILCPYDLSDIRFSDEMRWTRRAGEVRLVRLRPAGDLCSFLYTTTKAEASIVHEGGPVTFPGLRLGATGTLRASGSPTTPRRRRPRRASGTRMSVLRRATPVAESRWWWC